MRRIRCTKVRQNGAEYYVNGYLTDSNGLQAYKRGIIHTKGPGYPFDNNCEHVQVSGQLGQVEGPDADAAVTVPATINGRFHWSGFTVPSGGISNLTGLFSSPFEYEESETTHVPGRMEIEVLCVSQKPPIFVYFVEFYLYDTASSLSYDLRMICPDLRRASRDPSDQVLASRTVTITADAPEDPARWRFQTLEAALSAFTSYYLPNQLVWADYYAANINNWLESDCSISDVSTSRAAIDAKLDRFLESYLAHERTLFRDSQFNAVWHQAIRNCRMADVNNIANVVELRSLLGEIGAIGTVVKDPLKVKNWAKAFLSFKYGTRLTVADAKETYLGLCRAEDMPSGILTSRAGGSIDGLWPEGSPFKGSYGARVQFDYSELPLEFTKGWKTLCDWGLAPELERIWDLIPFSFVADWFVDVSNFLSSVDDMAYRQTLQTSRALRSASREISLDSVCKMLNIPLQNPRLKSYYRWVVGSVPPLDFDYRSSVTINRHYAEFGCVVLTAI